FARRCSPRERALMPRETWPRKSARRTDSSTGEREKADNALRYDFFLDDSRRANTGNEESGKRSGRLEHWRRTDDRATTLLFADALPRSRRRIQRQVNQG